MIVYNLRLVEDSCFKTLALSCPPILDYNITLLPQSWTCPHMETPVLSQTSKSHCVALAPLPLRCDRGSEDKCSPAPLWARSSAQPYQWVVWVPVCTPAFHDAFWSRAFVPTSNEKGNWNTMEIILEWGKSSVGRCKPPSRLNCLILRLTRSLLNDARERLTSRLCFREVQQDSLSGCRIAGGTRRKILRVESGRRKKKNKWCPKTTLKTPEWSLNRQE